MNSQFNFSSSYSNTNGTGFYHQQQQQQQPPAMAASGVFWQGNDNLQGRFPANANHMANVPDRTPRLWYTPAQYEAHIRNLEYQRGHYQNQAALYSQRVTRLRLANDSLRADLERAQTYNRMMGLGQANAARSVDAPQVTPQPTNTRKRALEDDNDDDDEVVITAVNTRTPTTITATTNTNTNTNTSTSTSSTASTNSGLTPTSQGPLVASPSGQQQQQQQQHQQQDQQQQQQPAKKARTADPAWLTANSDPNMLLARGKINATRAEELRREQLERTPGGGLFAAAAASVTKRRSKTRAKKQAPEDPPHMVAQQQKLLKDAEQRQAERLADEAEIEELFGGGDESREGEQQQHQQEQEEATPAQTPVHVEEPLPPVEQAEQEQEEKEAGAEAETEEQVEEEEEKVLSSPSAAGEALSTMDAMGEIEGYYGQELANSWILPLEDSFGGL